MKLNIKKIGESHNPPFIFLHGLMGEGEDWYELAKYFSDKYYCLLVDLPGHGKSTSEVSGFKALAKLILDSVNQNDKLNVIGYSMGGRVALYLILNFPNLFNKAVIESASPGIQSQNEREKRYKSDLDLFSNIRGFRSFLEEWYENPIFGDLKGLKEPIIERKLENDPIRLKKTIKALSVGIQPNFWERIKKLKVPTLYLSGEKDLKYTQIGKDLAKLSPAITNKVINNSGHITHLQNKKEFKSQIENYLNF